MLIPPCWLIGAGSISDSPLFPNLGTRRSPATARSLDLADEDALAEAPRKDVSVGADSYGGDADRFQAVAKRNPSLIAFCIPEYAVRCTRQQAARAIDCKNPHESA